MKANWISCLLGLCTAASAVANSTTAEWPEVKTEAKPGTRWWWLGSAVDKANLTYTLETYAKAGIGAVEITPIYGVKGNEKNDIDFLSDRWMEMLRHTQTEGRRLGIEIDMNTGTGWPFGGPEVSIEEAATRAIFNSWSYTCQSGGQEKGKKPAPYVSDIQPTDAKALKGLKTATFSGIWMYDEEDNVHDVTSYVTEGRTLVLEIQKTSKYKNRQTEKPLSEIGITLEEGKAYRFVALWNGKTLQAVKRAAPGGEGYVMDHFAPTAVNNYFGKFEKAFKRTGTSFPHTFFNDSYEVYGADWTPALLQEFEARRGYRLQDHFPAFLDGNAADHKRLICDYRETLSDLLLEVFTHTWGRWAHEHGAIIRNQAHGSPANLLDVYAAVDIPEIEGFGLSDFNIAGLRKDSLTKKNDSDLSMLKYAASAAHVTNKPYTSSETFTWLTEHFRTSLSQCKPDMDLMFVSGVNHCYFHGTTYSPKEASWPGYLFYAAMEMSPNNTIWTDAPAFFQYITRCQSFLQWGRPDNDFLVYLPVYDIWNDYPGRLLQFDIHSMAKKAPKFIEAVTDIYRAGYDMDYISDRMIEKTSCRDGNLITEGSTSYKALILPAARFMQPKTLEHIVKLAENGATIIFVGTYPTDVPGLSDLASRSAELQKIVKTLPTGDFSSYQVADVGRGRIVTAKDYATAMRLSHTALNFQPETMKSEAGLSSIRRSNPTGHHYFISSLQNKGVDGWVKLAVKAEAAVIFDPMTGDKGTAQVRNHNGTTEVRLQLASGESCILQTYSQKTPDIQDGTGAALTAWPYHKPAEGLEAITLDKGWSISFPATQPVMEGSHKLKTLKPWTELDIPNARTSKGTARYSIDIKLSKKQLSAKNADEWILDLGDVRESAHVYVNGKDAGIAFAVPYRIKVGHLLKPGKNRIEIDVTGLAANYLAEMDRNGIVWRKFKNANIANLKGGSVSYYGNWDVMPCGLNSEVKLVPLILAD